MNELSPWRIRRVAQNQEGQPEFSSTSESDEISLSAYWNILVKNWKIILTLFLLVFVPGAYYARSATPLYTATATIKIEPQNPQVTGLGELQPLGAVYDYHQTQFALLRSRPLAAKVITELGLDANKTLTEIEIVSPNPMVHLRSWIFFPQKVFSSVTRLFESKSEEKSNPTPQTTESTKPEPAVADPAKVEPELSVSPALVGQYLGFLGIAPIQQTRLVSINFTTPDPALSQTLANAHVQAFMRMTLESRFSLTQEAQEFLDQKKDELQQKLEKSEAELNQFRREHGVFSVDKGENIAVDRLVDLNKQLTSVRAQRLEAESLYRTVGNRNYQDLAQVMGQGLVPQLKSNLATLEADLARLASTFKPSHPRIQQLDTRITAARQALNDEVANVVRGIKSNYAAALEKEHALESEVEKQQKDALKLKELGVQYIVLQEEVNANRALYGSVLKRLSETNVSADLAVSNMQIVERAAKPSGASGPDATLYLLASTVSGLFLGLGVAFLREFLNSTVGTPDEVWRSVGLGTLGVVPHLKFLNRPAYTERLIGRRKQAALPPGSRMPAKELITNHGRLSIMTEAYRTIRTSLLLSQAEKPPQVILLTSPTPGEGKTVTSLNLAIALAHDGHTVLLVDADMRKGNCHAQLGLTNNRGLSNILTGGLSLDEGVQQTPVSGLALLSRGVPPPNPSELLGSGKMRDILKELRQQFEFILLDSPPVIALSDAAILSVLTDGVLLVFDGQKTSTASAQKAVERLDTVHARFLGVILNAVNLNDPHYSYYRTYSQYYYQDLSGNRELNERNARKYDERVTLSDRMKRLLKRKEKRNHPRDQGRKNDHNGRGNGDSASENPEEVRAKPFGNDTLGETNEGTTVKSAPASHPIAQGSSPAETASQAFLNRLMDVFMESVGPVAPFIVSHHIGLLGGSKDAFPKSRIGELVNSIELEILDPEMRLRFQKKIAEEIRNLENQPQPNREQN